MPAIAPSQLRRSLDKGPPASAYYLHGCERLLRDESLALLLDRLLEPGLRDFNLDILSAQGLDPEAVVAACATLPMMAERRVVVLRDIEAWKRKSKGKQPIIQYLQRPSPDTVLIFVQGDDNDPDADIIKLSTSVDCAELDGAALQDWLDGTLTRAGIDLSPDAREHLVRATGGNLGMLNAEAQKLAGLDSTLGAIDRDTVSAMVGVRFGETADDWRDAVLRDDVATALRLIPRVLELSGTTGVALVMQLGTSLLALRWARATAQARKLRDRSLADAIKRQLLFTTRPRVGNYDHFAQLLAEVAPRWTLPRLRAATASALAADIALKNTTISDDTGILTDLVLTLATSAARKAA